MTMTLNFDFMIMVKSCNYPAIYLLKNVCVSQVRIKRGFENRALKSDLESSVVLTTIGIVVGISF